MGKGYVIEAARTHFKIQDLDGDMTGLPDNVDKLHAKRRKELMESFIEPFVDRLIGPCSIDEVSVLNNVIINFTPKVK